MVMKSGFGHSASPGTGTPRFEWVKEIDTTVGASPAYYATITAMSQYGNKSLEELRMEDMLSGKTRGFKWGSNATNTSSSSSSSLVPGPDKNPSSLSLLSMAVWNNYIDTVRVMVENLKVPVNYHHSPSSSSSHATAGSNSPTVSSFCPYLLIAALQGHEEIVKYLIDKGGDVNGNVPEKYLLPIPKYRSFQLSADHSMNPLSGALIGGNVNIFRRLLNAGTMLTSLPVDPLSFACTLGAKNIALLLLDSYNYSATGNETDTLPQPSRSTGSRAVVVPNDILLAANNIRLSIPSFVTVASLTMKSTAPLWQACIPDFSVLHSPTGGKRNEIYSGECIEANYFPGPSGDNYRSPSRLELVQQLLQRGANPNLRSTDGIPLLFVCNDTSIIKLLIEKNADIGIDVDGWTLLHGISYRKSVDLSFIMYLLEKVTLSPSIHELGPDNHHFIVRLWYTWLNRSFGFGQTNTSNVATETFLQEWEWMQKIFIRIEIENHPQLLNEMVSILCTPPFIMNDKALRPEIHYLLCSLFRTFPFRNLTYLRERENRLPYLRNFVARYQTILSYEANHPTDTILPIVANPNYTLPFTNLPLIRYVLYHPLVIEILLTSGANGRTTVGSYGRTLLIEAILSGKDQRMLPPLVMGDSGNMTNGTVEEWNDGMDGASNTNHGFVQENVIGGSISTACSSPGPVPNRLFSNRMTNTSPVMVLDNVASGFGSVPNTASKGFGSTTNNQTGSVIGSDSPTSTSTSNSVASISNTTLTVGSSNAINTNQVTAKYSIYRVRETVLQLINNGIDVNQCDNFQNSPLHYAAALGQIEIMELLLQRGANALLRSRSQVSIAEAFFTVYVNERYGEAPNQANKVFLPLNLGLSDRLTHQWWMDRFMVKGFEGRVMENVPFQAVSWNMERLRRAIDVVLPYGVSLKDNFSHNTIPLFKLVTRRLELSPPLIEMLIDKGMVVNEMHRNGQTLLMARDVSVDVLKILVRKMDPTIINRRDHRGCTAIYYASQRIDNEAIRVLAEAGADATILDNGNVSPLLAYLVSFFDATNNDDLPGAPEAWDIDKRRPYYDAIKLLCERGAIINLSPDRYGRTIGDLVQKLGKILPRLGDVLRNKGSFIVPVVGEGNGTSEGNKGTSAGTKDTDNSSSVTTGTKDTGTSSSVTTGTNGSPTRNDSRGTTVVANKVNNDTGGGFIRSSSSTFGGVVKSNKNNGMPYDKNGSVTLSSSSLALPVTPSSSSSVTAPSSTTRGGNITVTPFVSRDEKRTWSSLASSYNGTFAVATVYGGYVYISQNSGIMWTPQLLNPLLWRACACSKDGKRIICVPSNSYIHYSSDYGETWHVCEQARKRYWYSVCCSEDGLFVVAVVKDGGIYRSEDGGVTFTECGPKGRGSWYSVSSSGCGKNLLACQSYGSVYTSNDYGTCWVQRNVSTDNSYVTVAVSGDGRRMITASNRGVFRSDDNGETWISCIDEARSWWAVTCSHDGRKLAAAVQEGFIYIEGGTRNGSWVPIETKRKWSFLTLSGNGKRLFGTEWNGNIYTADVVEGTEDEEEDYDI